MPSVSTFQLQAPVAPLNPTAQQALTELLQAQAPRKRLAACLNDTAKKLTEVAGQLNDRGTEQRQRHAKLQARLQANGEEMREEDRVEYETFQRKVKDLTQKMDHSIRGVIDAQTWLDDVPDALKMVATKTGALAEATQQQTQGPTPLGTQRNRLEDGMDMDGTGTVDAPVPAPPDPSNVPTALLQAAFEEQSRIWQSMSLTERYVDNNEYRGFYRTVYDAKNPGESAPLIPHASLWFAEEENPHSMPALGSQTGRGRQAEDDEDDDIEIASERVSLKCPITLLPFKDPLTSTKCPHSFEKEAILDMLRLSSDYLPFTADQEFVLSQTRDRRALDRKKKEMGTPTVMCPVCSCTLAEADLKPDPVLLRKVKRVEAATKRQQNPVSDSEEEEDEAPKSTQLRALGLDSSPARRLSGKEDEAPESTQLRALGLDSSPARRLGGTVEVLKKDQARSRIPQTQLPSSTPTTITAGGATVVDLDGDEDGEDEDEEMYDS